MDKRKLLKVIGVVLLGLLLFEGMLFIYGSSFATLLYQAIFFGKYNLNLISEIVLLLFSLLVLVIRKRLNILKPKSKNFIASLKRGVPILVIAILVLISNLITITGESLNIPNFISLVLFAITIGMAEEFFFRGFVQEEIVNAYGSTRKQVIISIVISGIIFGVVHLSNALGNQGIITTVMQVFQASSLGILIGSIYYVTKNIWSVVFLHSFYDFAILLGEVNTYKDCVSGDDISTAMLIFTLVGTLVYSIIYLVGAYLNLQERHVNEHINEEVTEEKLAKNENNASLAKKIVVVVIVVFIWISLFIPTDAVTNYETCYTYESTTMEGEISYSTKDEFILNDVSLSIANNNLVIRSIDGENYIEVETLENDIYDIYVYELDNNYHILLNADEILYYGYVSKDTVIYSNEFVNTLINSLEKFDVPSISSLGKIESDGITYPIIKTYISDYFIIKDNKVFVINND